MKRKEEVEIIVNALYDSGLVDEKKTDRARFVIKEALKDIRTKKFKEKQTKN